MKFILFNNYLRFVNGIRDLFNFLKPRKYFTLTNGTKVYFSKYKVAHSYVGWISSKLASREALIKLGVTGKMLLSEDGESYSYCDASEDVILNLISIYGVKFFCGGFCALGKDGYQLLPEHQKFRNAPYGRSELAVLFNKFLDAVKNDGLDAAGNMTFKVEDGDE